MSRWALAGALALIVTPALARGDDKVPHDYPSQVAVGQSPQGPVYVDGRKRTLYTMSLRWAKSRSGAGIEYCGAACLAAWIPLAASKDAKPVGQWSVIAGPVGPQWAYAKNPVFVFKADKAPGELGGDGWDDLWSTLFYIPPMPELAAPPGVVVIVAEGRNLLADAAGKPLVTLAAKTEATLAPLPAAMLSRPIGEWTVLRRSDIPQWAWRGRPVFVAANTDPRLFPSSAEAILP